ncbi:MAG TPA: DUF4058 family protein [Planctomycetaceae bacterium]|nr:DUF4058 family protein [Planctomycetaceae bacterium]
MSPAPLRASGEQVALDLQRVLNAVYDRAHYEMDVDYGNDPVPPLRQTTRPGPTPCSKGKGLR